MSYGVPDVGSKPDVSINLTVTVLEINLRLPRTIAALANGPKVAKVSHCRCEVLHTWGELCERSGALPGDTPLQSPLDRLATRGDVTRQGTLNNPTPPAGPATGNGRGGCQIN